MIILMVPQFVITVQGRGLLPQPLQVPSTRPAQMPRRLHLPPPAVPPPIMSLGSATTIAFDCWAQASASAVVVAARACSPSLRLDVGFPDNRPPFPDLG